MQQMSPKVGRRTKTMTTDTVTYMLCIFFKSWILCSIATKLRPGAYTCFDVDNNVKEEVFYQGRWDLRAKTTSKHVAPITALKEENKGA